jgi:two-component system sensor kinase FixL
MTESLEDPSTTTSALREANERLRWFASIVASSDDAIISKTLDGIITSWNKGAERMFGYTAEEAVGKPVMILIPPDRHNEEYIILERIGRGERVEHYETVRKRKDGSSIVISLTVSPVKDVEGKIIGASKIARDITDQKLAEARERALMAELSFMNRVSTAGELSASIAHELKQPLTAIVVRASAARRWLAAENLNIDKVRAAFDQIENAGLRAGEIIANIKSMFTKETRAKSEVDINKLVRTVMGLVSVDLRRHEIELTMELDNQLPPVLVNHVELQQVVLNLVMNAMDAMRSVRPRVLSVKSKLNGSVHVSIADTGIGIDPAIADEIFKPLFTTKEHGMGMGLSICHSIIEKHGGRIWASPGAPSGTILQFVLPTN